MAVGVEEILPNDFGKYRLVRKIATGGMAEIFLAHTHDRPKDPIVIKRILPHLIKSAEFVSMFLDEARIAAQLDHPNIVKIFDIGSINGSYFIAMEYVHGEDIRRIYNCAYKLQRSLPLSHSIRVIADAACGLAYAHKLQDFTGHAMGVVHRDVSPQNILVTYEGGVKVVDFGIAKAANKVNQTRAGVLKGKYSYMSPEQALGDPIDHKTDIFALGIILYETTTGTRLFKRHNELATLQAIIKCEYVLPSEALPGYPPELERVLLKALSKDPDDRYHDAQDFSDSLYDFLHTSELYVEREIIAEFMRDLFKDRLEEEERLGTPLIPNQDDVREEMADQTKESSRLSAQPSHPYEPGEKTGNADTALGASYESPTEDDGSEGTSPEVDEEDLPPDRPKKEKKKKKKKKEAPSTLITPQGRAHQRLSTEVIRPKENGHESPVSMTEGNPPADMMPTVAAEPAYRPPGSLDPRVIEPRTIAPERSMEPRRAAELTEQVRARASIPALGKDGSTKDESRDQSRDQARDPPRDEHKEERSKEERKDDRKEERKAREPREPREPRESRESRESRDEERKKEHRAHREERAQRPVKSERDRPARRTPTPTELHRGFVPRIAIALGAILAAVLAGIVASRIVASFHSGGPAPIESHDESGERFGRMTVLTEPGAAVWSEDQMLGIATSDGVAGPFRLSAGPHKLRVTIDEVGFERDRSVQVLPDGIHELEIRGRKGWLSFRVQPWAKVFVDGHDMGLTPLPNLQLYEGTHQIVLMNDGIKKRFEQRVRIDAGQTFELKVNMVESGSPL